MDSDIWQVRIQDRIRSWIRTAVDEYGLYRLEVACSISTVLLGAWLLRMGLNGPPPPSYQSLEAIAPLWFWGVAIMLVGFSTRLGLYWQNVKLRQAVLVSIFALRAFMFLSAWAGTGGISTSIPEHISWMLVSAWAYIRLVIPDDK